MVVYPHCLFALSSKRPIRAAARRKRKRQQRVGSMRKVVLTVFCVVGVLLAPVMAQEWYRLSSAEGAFLLVSGVVRRIDILVGECKALGHGVDRCRYTYTRASRATTVPTTWYVLPAPTRIGMVGEPEANPVLYLRVS